MSTPQRAVLYLRQSVSREDSISLELQESACRAHCDREGYNVVGVEADPGISGRTWKRPGVVKVMEIMESGKADVVILWKWSRWSRSRLDWAVAADRVETAGGRIESATEAIDVSTSTGRLARGMMTEFAAFESERIGDTWKESHARRINLGLPANGRPRFGYTYTKETGFTQDPETAPVLREMYLRYIAGMSFYQITNWANSTGTLPAYYGGNRLEGKTGWGTATILAMLDSGFGAGLLNSKGAKLPGAHEGVITAPEWEEYQSRRATRRPRKRGENSGYVYTSLIRCQCGYAMHGGYKGTPKERYACSARIDWNPHKGGFVRAARVDEAVQEWLASIADDVNTSATAALTTRSVKVVSKKERLTKELTKLLTRKDTLTNKFLDETIPQDSYQRLVAELSGKIKAVEADLSAAKVEESHPPAELVPDLLKAWGRLDSAVKRDILRRLISKIEVTTGFPKSEVTITALWEG